MSDEVRSRTAPLLLLDLHDYNFEGIFTDIFVPGSAKSRCQHLYTTNGDRSFLPQYWDEKPSQSTKWALALTCQLCRVHINIIVDFGDSQRACPSQEYPLHHFSFTPASASLDDAYPREYRFKCSYNCCQADLWAVLKVPNLQLNEIEYLVDVTARMKTVLERSPSTKNRNPLEALNVLRTYIRDCLDSKGKLIPYGNGGFESCLGDGAGNMLARLGFVPAKDENGKAALMLPQPPPHNRAEVAFDMTRCALEDVREELTALIQGRPEFEKRGNISDMYPPPPGSGKRDLERLMGAAEYDTILPINRWHPSRSPELYSGLGALPDFADTLLAWCYDQQCRINASRTPYFFRCLKQIAESRQSEELIIKALTLESQGVRTDVEIADAFEAIGVDTSHARYLNDENILSRYRSLFQDSGNEGKQRMRQALAIIGESRQSITLRDAAKGSLETYEQALAYLGADENTLDEYILAVKTAKEQEPYADKTAISKAVELIAAARNSAVLQSHVQDENQMIPIMDINTAYNMFSADPTADSDTLTLAFPGLLHDNPERREEIIRAMKVIAEARGNNELLQQAQSALQAKDGQSHVQPTPLSDPRGLDNIGNTCYLNSFLQYLFTIKPLRELVQNMMEYHQDLSSDALCSKKVGDERVTKHQVLRAQKFVHELSNLFETLKTARSRSVTLERSLAALTVAPTGDWTAIREQEKRRRSTMVSSKAPKLGVSTNFATEQAGLLHSADGTSMITESSLEDKATVRAIDEVMPMTNGQNDAYVDRELNTRTESHVEESAFVLESQTAIKNNLINTDAEPQIEKSEAEALGHDAVQGKDVEPQLGPEKVQSLVQSPSDPPPVPPRREAEDSKHFKDASTERIEEWARQQDMREALANVFRQLRWAIKDEVESDGGEQVDLISRLFYGKENIVTLKENGERVTETIPFHSLYVIPDESYQNIYGMLDGAYGFRDIADESSQERRSQYSTFTGVPPVLHVDIAVTAWDKEAQHAVRRAPFKVAESFYMDRYVDNPALVETRKRISELMSKLVGSKEIRTRLTKNEIGIDLPSALRTVGAYLDELSDHAEQIGFDGDMIPKSLITNLHDLGDEASGQLKIVNGEIDKANQEMSSLFPEEGSLLYQLHAVCMHTGRADSGHYFIYIYDSAERRWYKYNDESVERIEHTQPILDPNGGVLDGIPAMLVYVRETEVETLMQTVCRAPEGAVQDPGPASYRMSSSPKPNPELSEWDLGRPVSLDGRSDW